MQRGSLSVLPHDGGDITIGVVDDDSDAFLAFDRISIEEARSFQRRLSDAIRIAGAESATDKTIAAGSIA